MTENTKFVWTRYHVEQVAWYFAENPDKWRTLDDNPPFYGVDFNGVNLEDANLEDANLYGANLVRVNLEDANLVRANLVRVNLEDANLVRANLYGANLVRANLVRANLVRANLYSVNLEDANLYGANLYGANLYGANLVRVNLEDAKNIFTIFLPGMSSRNDVLSGDIQTIDGKKVVMITAGCFRGTLAEFEARVREQKGDDALYLATLPLIRAWAKQWTGVTDEPVAEEVSG